MCIRDRPSDGWPVILYAHGTGGDYQTFVRESLDLRAALIERKGKPPVRMAMIGIDQVLHGPRDPSGSNPEITFFNLQNLDAARDNVKQGAADDFQLLRLVEEMNVAKAPTTGRPIRFDKKRIYFMGHSQGGPVSYTHLDVYKRQPMCCATVWAGSTKPPSTEWTGAT